MAESASPLEAARAFGERVLDRLMDPLAADRRRADLVRYYRQGAGRELAPDVIAEMPDAARNELIRGLAEDRSELAAWAQRTSTVHADTAVSLLVSAGLGVFHGITGSGWMTAAVGGAAGLASFGVEDPDVRAAARAVCISAASTLAYRLGLAAALASDAHA